MKFIWSCGILFATPAKICGRYTGANPLLSWIVHRESGQTPVYPAAEAANMFFAMSVVVLFVAEADMIQVNYSIVTHSNYVIVVSLR